MLERRDPAGVASAVDHIAGHQGHDRRRRGDLRGHAMVHRGRGILEPNLAVHAQPDLEPVHVADLVGGDEAWAHRTEGVEGLAEVGAHRPSQPAAEDVDEARVAEDAVQRVVLRHVAGGAADDQGDAALGLEVGCLGLRQDDGLAVPDDRLRALVVEVPGQSLVRGVGLVVGGAADDLARARVRGSELHRGQRRPAALSSELLDGGTKLREVFDEGGDPLVPGETSDLADRGGQIDDLVAPDHAGGEVVESHEAHGELHSEH